MSLPAQISPVSVEPGRRGGCPALPLVLALGICSLMPWLLALVFSCSTTLIPYQGTDVVLDYTLGLVWAGFLGAGILFWPVRPGERQALLWIWLVKSLVALGLMLAYEYRYGMDPDGYFGNAVSRDFLWRPVGFDNGTQFIHDLTWLHLQLVPGSYHAAKVGCAMIGLVAIYLCYRAAVLYLGREDIRILYLLALFPSILFWSSILGKDPIVLFGFSLYLYGVVACYKRRRLRHLVTAALGILLCSLVRIWVVPISVLPLAVFLVAGRRSTLLWRLLLLLAGTLLLMASISKLSAAFSIATVENLFESRSYAVGAFEGGGSSYLPPEIAGFTDLFTALPRSVFTALFRPLPWDIGNLFGFLEGLDGLILLVLLVFALVRTPRAELRDPLLIWALLLVLCWATVYGLVTYNLGSLVRYKLQILPVLLGVLLYLARRRARTVSEPLSGPASHATPSPLAGEGWGEGEAATK